MNPIQQRMLKMLVYLRFGIGIAGVSLPIILVGWGQHKGIHFAGSMSAYYHATDKCWLPNDANGHVSPTAADPDPCAAVGEGPLRNWFVGTLFFIGGAMLLIKGFNSLEDKLLDAAGILAICVALIPMSWPGPGSGPSWHFRSALGFFICAGLTVVVCSRTTLRYVKAGWKTFFIFWYAVCTVLMLGLPAFVFFSAYKDSHLGFWLEAVSVGSFGAYWLLKTWELKISDLEGRALRGETFDLEGDERKNKRTPAAVEAAGA